MFLSNKYSQIYERIVDRAKTRQLDGYGENHHILPKSLGGTNKKLNIVRLTAREHYIVHLCLVRFTTGDARFKMVCAAKQMIKRMDSLLFNSKIYEALRKEHALGISIRRQGMKFSAEHKQRLRESHLGYVMPDEQRQKISQRNLGRIVSDETRKKISLSHMGRKASDATRQKLSASHKGYVPTAQARKNMSNAAIGRLKSDETRRRMSEARKKAWAEGKYENI